MNSIVMIASVTLWCAQQGRPVFHPDGVPSWLCAEAFVVADVVHERIFGTKSRLGEYYLQVVATPLAHHILTAAIKYRLPFPKVSARVPYDSIKAKLVRFVSDDFVDEVAERALTVYAEGRRL